MASLVNSNYALKTSPSNLCLSTAMNQMITNMLRQLLLTVSLLVTQTTMVYAQNYEITPLVGWRGSSSLEEESTGETVDLNETRSFGILLSIRQYHNSTYDLLFTRQDTETQTPVTLENASIRFDYYHIGGTVFYEQKHLQPFLSGGLGITHISPTNNNFSSETKLSLSIGGGIKFPLTKSIGLRLEARGYGTAVDSGGSILCTGGSCLIRFKSELFTQFEAMAGLSVAF